MDTSNLTNDWLDLMRDESNLADLILEEVQSEALGKVFEQQSDIDSLLSVIAEGVTGLEGFDLEYVWELETVFDIAVEPHKNGVRLVGCKIKTLFLHEKMM